VDRVKVAVAGRDGMQLVFEHCATQLPPGVSIIPLFCPVGVLIAFNGLHVINEQYRTPYLVSSPPRNMSTRYLD
jgi:hypothetical protein